MPVPGGIPPDFEGVPSIHTVSSTLSLSPKKISKFLLTSHPLSAIQWDEMKLKVIRKKIQKNSEWVSADSLLEGSDIPSNWGIIEDGMCFQVRTRGGERYGSFEPANVYSSHYRVRFDDE